MKSSGTFGDAELQEAHAKESGAKIEFVRYMEQLRRGIIEKALKDGKKVFPRAHRASTIRPAKARSRPTISPSPALC